MTIPPRRTVRPASRDYDETGPATEFAGLYASRAPESMTPPAPFTPVHPERRSRVGQAQLSRLADRLSQRDRAVMQSIDRFGFMTTSQLRVIHFHDHRTAVSAARVCRRVLQRLAELQVVEVLGRRIGGWQFGSEATIWRLGLAGDRLLRSDDNSARPRFKQPSPRFLDHRLTVADCVALLTNAQHEQRLELLHADPEPASWRAFLGGSGARETLKPDLYAVTAAGDFEDHWFCEIDRATESLPTIRKKCQQYERYRRTGREQHNSGLFPWVVWIAPDDRRAIAMQRAIAGSRDLDQSIYKVTTTAAFASLILGSTT